MAQRAESETKGPGEARARIRSGEHTGPTGGLAPGHVQANLVALLWKYAFDLPELGVCSPRCVFGIRG